VLVPTSAGVEHVWREAGLGAGAYTVDGDIDKDGDEYDEGDGEDGDSFVDLGELIGPTTASGAIEPIAIAKVIHTVDFSDMRR
jgi:hypothetical protein